MAKRARRPRFEAREMTVAEAIGAGYGDIAGLAEEIREVVDNMSEKFSQTSRYQTLEATADTLEGAQDEPEVPEAAGKLTLTVQVTSYGKRGPSRAARCSDAVNYVTAARDRLQERLEELDDVCPEIGPTDGDDSERDDLQALIDDLENAVSEWESAKFPGMYG